jgi:uncharacterized protein (DUF2236 family)
MMGHVSLRSGAGAPEAGRAVRARAAKGGRAAVLASTRVTADDLERELAAVRAAAPSDPRAGVFGPESVMWRIDREALLFLGAGRAALLQLAHPWVAAAIAERSRVLSDPIGRFHRTFGIIFVLVFGALDQAFAAARRLHQLHGAIQGVLPSAAGPFAAGSCYRADDVGALRWVHATLIETSLTLYEIAFPPLTATERERYWAESRRYAGLFGIPASALPPDWDTFVAYNEAMWHSATLTVSPQAHAIARELLAGSRGSRLRPPAWYRALTAHILPARLRDDFGLSYGDAERRAAERSLTWIRRLYPRLPNCLRLVGPYQEARALLAGRHPDPAMRLLNRLWIGRPRLVE